MVQLFIALPVLLSLYLLYKHPAHEAFLAVYLPCLMLIPAYLDFKVGGLAVNTLSGLTLLFALVGVAKEFSRWRFTATDIAVLVMVFSAYYSDAHYRPIRIGLYAATSDVLLTLCPYLIGRTLIERPGIRNRTAKTIVFCLVLVTVASLWEYRMTSNVFEMLSEKVTGHPSAWGAHLRRWGFARTSGPYGQSIIAGMMFSSGLILQLWLYGAKLWQSAQSVKTRSKFAVLAGGALGLGLFMTQSRGPWIGCAMGLIIALVGLARNRKKAVIIAGIILTLSLSVTYVALDNYSNVEFKRTGATADTKDQQDAAYRRELLTTYTPLVEQGGFWGWGTPFPLAGTGVGTFKTSQLSIDNEYLRMAMAQGYFGLSLFIFVLLATIVKLARRSFLLPLREDGMFTFALLGVVVASSFTLTTVFLGEPMIQLIFLICGWAQSIRPSHDPSRIVREGTLYPARFLKVFV